MAAPFALDPDWRGVPPGRGGLSSADVSSEGWSPADGRMSLPLLTLHLPTFDANRRAVFELCRRSGAIIAPHAKTPMCPAIASRMVDEGAWGTSVADLRQAGVMLRHGLRRIVIANGIGGRQAARRLAALLAGHRDAEVFTFVDSAELVRALDDAWRSDPTLPTLKLLVEVGCGRGGARTQTEVDEVLSAWARADGGRIRLAGVATYEGTANRPTDEAATRLALDDLFARMGEALTAVRGAVGPGEPLLLSAGGSTLFDVVIARSEPILRGDGSARLMLRCGSCYYGDHGVMPDRFAAIAARNLLGHEESALLSELRPALRLWAEVLHGRGGSAVCGLGLRDAAHDQGMPVPLRLWRDGRVAGPFGAGAAISKFNDQHAFVDGDGTDLRVGDVVEFGIRHPCTTMDKHDLIYGLGSDGTVRDVFRTHFG